MAQRECEPLGVAEFAAYAGVREGTIYQWSFRDRLPEPDWVVNRLACWNIQTIRAYLIADRGWTPERVRERDEAWPALRGTTRSKAKNTWTKDPERTKQAVKKRALTHRAKQAQLETTKRTRGPVPAQLAEAEQRVATRRAAKPRQGPEPSLPLKPLVDKAGGAAALRDLLGLSNSQWARLKRRGEILRDEADKYAADAGFRPADIWGDQWTKHTAP